LKQILTLTAIAKYSSNLILECLKILDRNLLILTLTIYLRETVSQEKKKIAESI